jgi:hypothetical protein
MRSRILTIDLNTHTALKKRRKRKEGGRKKERKKERKNRSC